MIQRELNNRPTQSAVTMGRFDEHIGQPRETRPVRNHSAISNSIPVVPGTHNQR